MKKKILIAVVLLLIAIQFIPIKKNQTVEESNQFLTFTSANPQVSEIIKTSCFDCHSNYTNYPWYNKIAPVSWYLNRHINEGKKHLNFSEWDSYDAGKKSHKLEECAELVGEGEMPLSSYTLIHKNAKLSEEQKTILVAFFKAKM